MNGLKKKAYFYNTTKTQLKILKKANVASYICIFLKIFCKFILLFKNKKDKLQKEQLDPFPIPWTAMYI